MDTLAERPNNNFMWDSNSSRTGSKEFTGTSSWEEAVSLLKNGYPDYLDDIKKALNKSKKLTSKMYSKMPRPVPENHVFGFVPNVPNALRGLPQSMITIERNPQKRKTISILYSIGDACWRDTDDFIDAGVALVSAINMIEASGIRTRLQLGFMPSTQSGEIVFPTVKLKDFGEPFALQKICFPLIHPSMFRRIGFKYLETCPFCTKDFSFGYGAPVDLSTLEECLNTKDTYVLNTAWIKDKIGCDIEQILTKLGVCI
ncbi:MAG: hypothetical protein K2N48_01630 [Muribaculaceae bacterium]|nr:hypothetical protein [Muribaculaceae bacterium]